MHPKFVDVLIEDARSPAREGNSILFTIALASSSPPPTGIFENEFGLASSSGELAGSLPIRFHHLCRTPVFIQRRVHLGGRPLPWGTKPIPVAFEFYRTCSSRGGPLNCGELVLLPGSWLPDLGLCMIFSAPIMSIAAQAFGNLGVCGSTLQQCQAQSAVVFLHTSQIKTVSSSSFAPPMPTSAGSAGSSSSSQTAWLQRRTSSRRGHITDPSVELKTFGMLFITNPEAIRAEV